VSPERPIDEAMSVLSDKKQHVRKLWVDEVRFREIGLNGEVLYVTLCGAEGFDIGELIAAGVIETEANGAIKQQHVKRVVAFEKNMPAVANIKKKFHGLSVREKDIHDQLKISTPFANPSNEEKKIFAAPVINLDYDKSINITDDFKIPIVEAALRLAHFHQNGHFPWTLLVTVNATINWSVEVQDHEKTFLGSYTQAQSCQAYFTSNVGGPISSSTDLRQLSSAEQQHLIAIHLPLRIAARLVGDQWKVSVHAVCLYSGGGGAPMATWILRIDPCPTAESERQQILAEIAEEVIDQLAVL
jgi:hypothetical protein